MKFNVCYRTKLNSEVYAISIMTAITIKHYKGRYSQNRDRKCFKIKFVP